MTTDSAYLTTSLRSLGYLIDGAGGEWTEIPQHYLNYFNHTYADGDVSLLPAVSKLENLDFLESWQIEEVLSTLSKVNPEHWPNYNDIRSIDAELLLSGEPEPSCNFTELEFVEDNLGASEKTQMALKAVLESVFGAGVSRIRSKKGDYPSPSNNFLQEKDGTFAGVFKFEDHMFDFEIAPTEAGWICTYRLDEKSLDKLDKPEFQGQRKNDKPKHRKVRSQGWR